MNPDELVDPEEVTEEGVSLPTFIVDALPTPEELTALAVEAVSAALGEFDPKLVADAPSRRSRGYSDAPHIEVGMTEDPESDLQFIVSLTDGVSMVVIVKPEHFDRTNKGQMTLFQQCLALLEALSNAPERDEGIVVGHFSLPPSDDEWAANWREIRDRWKKAEAQ